MTNSLQDLIDASIFISTEYQARLAELVGTSEWNVDFTSQSLDFETTPAGAGVRAWTLLEGHELTLEAPTYKGIGRVIAKTLQSEEIHNQVLAVDSYAQQRGFHIAWDTEATAVLTATDGALRLWFDDGRISGIEQADPQVGPEAAAQSAQREQEAAERAAARAEAEAERAVQIAEHAPVADTDETPAAEVYEAPVAEAQPAPAEQPIEEHEPEQARVYTDASIGAEDEQYPEVHEASAEQAPAEQPIEEPAAHEAQGEYTEEEIAEYVEPIRNAGDAPDLAAEHEEAAHEEYERQHFEERREEEQQKPEPKKKGFFSRFFGL